MLPRRLVVSVAVGLVIVATALIAVAIVYFRVPATHLPSFWPGYDVVRHTKTTGRVLPSSPHTSRGLVALLVAIGAISVAWWTTFRYQPGD